MGMGERLNSDWLEYSLVDNSDLVEKAVYIGANSEYAAYVHEGTGKYAVGGGGQPWVLCDEHSKYWGMSRLRRGHTPIFVVEPLLEIYTRY